MSRNFTAAAAEAPTPLSVRWEQPETGGAPQTELPSLLDALKIDGSGEQSTLEEMQEQLEQATEEALLSPAGEGAVLSAPQTAQASAAFPHPLRAAQAASAYAATARGTAPQAAEAKDAVAATA